jgi:type-2 restriction enzyme hpaII
MYRVIRSGLIFFNDGINTSFIFKIKSLGNNIECINSLDGIMDRVKEIFSQGGKLEFVKVENCKIF